MQEQLTLAIFLCVCNKGQIRLTEDLLDDRPSQVRN